MAALGLLRDEPRRVEKLRRNASALRTALTARGPAHRCRATSHIVTVHAGPAAASGALVDRILEKGLFVTVERAGDAATLRLSVMASHTKSELTEAARTLSRERCRRPCARPPPGARRSQPGAAARRRRVFDGLAEAA